MLILAIDTSTLSGSVAVLRDDHILKSIGEESRETYSSRMFRHLRGMLDELQLSLGQFDAYAVIHGPGSFTGLRVGLAAVKGWAEVFAKPIIAVSALEVVAAMVNEPSEFIAPVIDARRGQVYFGVYARSGGESLRKAAEEQVAAPVEFLQWLEAKGYDARKTVIASSTVAMLQPLLEHSPFSTCRLVPVSPFLAETLARLAAVRLRRGETISALELDANYIRRSDAELLWRGK
jgi:tRNA threonylcarbamoyladenosine biosynthesis protein TsaB